jgi:hypothetical protein
VLISVFYSVSSVTFDSTSLSVSVVFSYITVKEVSTGFDINWGNPIPAVTSTETLDVTQTLTNTRTVTTVVSGATVTQTVTDVATVTSTVVTSYQVPPSTVASSGSSAVTTSATAAATSGLPSTPIGTLDEQADFDQSLDDALGLMDSTSSDFYSLLLPGVDVSTLSARGVLKRSLFSSIRHAVR